MLSSKEDSTIIWNIQYCNPPTVLRYCKKCAKKASIFAQGNFVSMHSKNLAYI